jgi:hypothetical protein
MSNRGLLIVAIVCAVAVWLATTGVGAVIGFFIGIVIAFFVAPLVFGTVYLFKLPESAAQTILNGLMAAYGAVVLLVALRGVLALMRGDAGTARRHWALAIVLATLAAVFWFSNGALQAAWH